MVHACWDEESFAIIDEAIARHGRLTDAFVVEGSRKSNPLYSAIDVVLKGREMKLPEGVSFRDKDGHERHDARVRWFEDPRGKTLRNYSLPEIPHLPALPVPEAVRRAARPYPSNSPPVFFGHYWLDGKQPVPLASNVFCLDYSVARGGFLCGYRAEGGGPIGEGGFRSITAGRKKVVTRSENGS